MWIERGYYHLHKPCRYVRLLVYFLISAHLWSLLSRQQRDKNFSAGYLLCVRPYRQGGYVSRPTVRTRRSRLTPWVSLYYSVYNMLSISYDTLPLSLHRTPTVGSKQVHLAESQPISVNKSLLVLSRRRRGRSIPCLLNQH